MVYRKIITVCFLFMNLSSIAQVKTLKSGDIAPAIKLLSTDNKIVSFDDFPSAKGFVIVFIGNGCPYSKAYEQRIMEFDKKYSSLGFPVIAIDPNDSICSAEDAFSEMKKRAASSHYTFPFLFDEEQKITAAYGPTSTPYVFIISKTGTKNIVEYTGAIDNDTRNNDPLKHTYVEDAINALLNNKKPVTTAAKSIGCGICWKKTD